jgi:hypothetical protein
LVGSSIATIVRRSFAVPSVFMLNIVLEAGPSKPPAGLEMTVAPSPITSASSPLISPPSAIACRLAEAG